MTFSSHLALLTLLLLPACQQEPDGCEQLCARAEEKFSSCLDEGGTSWGTSVGFTSEADFANWCSTFTWEEEELGRADQCDERQAVIDEGDCAAWYTAWGETL